MLLQLLGSSIPSEERDKLGGSSLAGNSSALQDCVYDAMKMYIMR